MIMSLSMLNIEQDIMLVEIDSELPECRNRLSLHGKRERKISI